MHFPIDVLFVSREGRVVKISRALPSWRIGVAWRAFAVIELPAGIIDRTGIRLDDVLQLTIEKSP
jgi:uncharacterized membrane protein (UPF0127 family)